MSDGSLSETFEVKSGVIQGGILSPLVFVLVIDYVMRRVAEETMLELCGEMDINSRFGLCR